MKEFKKSIKRIYTRFVVLTAVVVFGAIAIAQAKKESDLDAGANAPAPSSAALDTFVHTPIPSTSTDVGEPARFPVVPVAVEIESSDADEAYGSVHAADLAGFSDDVSTPYQDPPAMTPDSGPAAFPADITQEPVRRTNPHRPSAEDFDSLPADEVALPDIDAGDSYDTPVDELPDAMAADAELPPVNSATFESTSDFQDEPVEEYVDVRDGQAYADPYSDTAPAEPFDAQPLDPMSQQHVDDAAGLTAVDAQVILPDAEPQPAEPQPAEPQPAARAVEPAAAQPIHPQPSAQVSEFEAQPLDAAAAAALPAAANEFSRQPAPAEFDQRPDAVNVATRTSPTGLGKPGPQSLEGPQTPTLTVHKTAPTEVRVGQPAKFEIRVRNVGRVPANNVIIRDQVPAGTEFVDSTPPAKQAADGTIFWETGTLPPGQELAISMELMPRVEGLVGSVATVSFEASASARSRATKPDLRLEHTGPLKVLEGDAVRFSIKLSNPGSGAATHVVLEENVPVGLSHTSGAKLEYEVGTIQPGQTRQLELTLKAAQAGHVVNTLVARADGDLAVEDVSEFDVVAPKLQVAIDGPKTRYLDRQATFTVSVANPGTAPAQNVELVAQLPAGLRFVSTNNSGYFDQSRNAVIWSLEKLPAGEMGRAQFTAMPIQMGSFQIRAESRAEKDLRASQEHALVVEGIAALFFGLADKVDPIEINGQTTYEINVVNQGSKDATNVTFTAMIPEGMQLVNVQGPTAESVQNQQVQFGPLDRLPPKGEATYRIMVQGKAAGDHRFRVEMTSDEITTPVLKEESTRVYAD